MPLVYVTGVAGTGKSTICAELLRRGYLAVDTDDPAVGGPVNNTTNAPVTMPPVEERSPQWFSDHSWRVKKTAIDDLKQHAHQALVFLCGATTHDEEIYAAVDQTIFLTLHDDEILCRLENREDNDYGKSQAEQDFVLKRNQEQRAWLSTSYASTVDASQPVEMVVDNVICLVTNARQD